jgi:hypothetical protein
VWEEVTVACFMNLFHLSGGLMKTRKNFTKISYLLVKNQNRNIPNNKHREDYGLLGSHKM